VEMNTTTALHLRWKEKRAERKRERGLGLQLLMVDCWVEGDQRQTALLASPRKGEEQGEAGGGSYANQR
jgi:hypothetical protein